MSFHVGETFGDYEIKAIIGAGRTGQVFLAEHRLTRRKEAVKVLNLQFANHTTVQRFQREIALQAGLNHPNIAAVHNAIEVDGRIVMVMEFIEGHTLDNLLKAGAVPLELGLEYVRQTLSALSYAHANGVIHRDVNPENLIVTQDGVVKLTDFGVAKSFCDVQVTNFGEVVGTLHYMPPERVQGDSNPDPRSDLYSVGAMLYEMVTRRKPFEGENVLALMQAQVEADAKRPTELDPNLSPEWDSLILKALAKKPADRYSSADEFLEALQRFLGEPAPSPSEVSGHTPQRSVPLKLRLILASPFAVMLLAAAGMAATHFRNPDPPPAVMIHIAPPGKLASDARAAAANKPVARKITAQGQRRKTAPQVVASKSVDAPPSAPFQDAVPAIDTTPGPVLVTPTVAEPAPPDAVAPAASKKRFWGKINPFRKKKIEATGAQN